MDKKELVQYISNLLKISKELEKYQGHVLYLDNDIHTEIGKQLKVLDKLIHKEITGDYHENN